MGPVDSREMHQYCCLILWACGDEFGVRCYYHCTAVADSLAVAVEVTAKGGAPFTLLLYRGGNKLTGYSTV